MSRLSEKLLVSHYDSNYGGAVNHLNAITPQLAGPPKISDPLKLS
jgi:Fe-Mn family superoxide dismutase